MTRNELDINDMGMTKISSLVSGSAMEAIRNKQKCPIDVRSNYPNYLIRKWGNKLILGNNYA